MLERRSRTGPGDRGLRPVRTRHDEDAGRDEHQGRPGENCNAPIDPNGRPLRRRRLRRRLDLRRGLGP